MVNIFGMALVWPTNLNHIVPEELTGVCGPSKKKNGGAPRYELLFGESVE